MITFSKQKFKVNNMLNVFEKWCVIFAVQYTFQMPLVILKIWL